MYVIHGHKHVPPEFRGSAVAIGNFDGVHRGHRALIAEAKAQGRAKGALSSALVFDPHPREFFQPDEQQFRLTPLARKLALFEELGLDVAFVEPFNAELAAIPAQASSSACSSRASASDTSSSATILFRQQAWRQSGADGAGRGRAGLRRHRDATRRGEWRSVFIFRRAIASCPGRRQTSGIYAWRAVASSGPRRRRRQARNEPRLSDRKRSVAEGHDARTRHLRRSCALLRYRSRRRGLPRYASDVRRRHAVLEVFLFDFTGDLYGRDVEVEFIDFIRGDRRFGSVEELVAQMDKDIAKARAILASV